MTAEEKTVQHVVTDVRDGIQTVRLNRPEKKNALTVAMYDALASAFEQAEHDDAIRVTIITGTGDSFSSGNDVLDFMNAFSMDEESPVVRFVLGLSQVSKPVIAAVNGTAIGIGVTMLLHCDLIYAAEEATFRMPFVNLGLCPEAGSTFLLPRVAGHQRAAELLFFGEAIDAETAREIGIVNAVYPRDALMDSVRQKAQQLCEQPAASLRTAKMLMKRPTAAELRESMEEEVTQFMQRLKSPEFAEAVQALFQRRKPDFSNFS